VNAHGEISHAPNIVFPHRRPLDTTRNRDEV
jgi:hypothetical protein